MLKGSKDGILIDIQDIKKDLKDIEEKLRNKEFFGENKDFLIKEKDKIYYKDLLSLINKYGHNLILIKEIEQDMKKINIKNIKELDINIQNIKSKIIKKTLRSGQKIDFDGDVVVVGDVNPGSEVLATGDIFIFGKARGLIHAGKNGDKSKIIIALSMEVTQIRIANIYAKGSKDNKPQERIAEKAYLDKDNTLIIEEYKIL